MNIKTGDFWFYATPSGTPIINTTPVTIKAAVTNKRNFVTDFQIFNNHATVATLVVLKDGATVIWTGNLPAVSGNVVVNLSVPLLICAGNALTVTCITTGSSVFINASGYTEG